MRCGVGCLVIVSVRRSLNEESRTAKRSVHSVMDELKWCEQFIEETRQNGASTLQPVRERLREGGMSRAEHWGWINTYTYTKSMGEQLIAQTSGLTYAIVRPSIVESSIRFPFPGWNEGFTTWVDSSGTSETCSTHSRNVSDSSEFSRDSNALASATETRVW
jgi:Male sterility protein